MSFLKLGNQNSTQYSRRCFARNDVEALKKEWKQKLAQVEAKMACIGDRNISEVVLQAQTYVERLVNEKRGRDNQRCATFILESLVKEYDWVYWSVRVYDPIVGFDNHCVNGPNRFHFFRLNNVNVVVSYSTDPKPIDAGLIHQLMHGKDGWRDAREVVEAILNNVPNNYMVHAVRRYKGLWVHDNFPDACTFWENYSGVTLCVHST